MNLLTQAIRKQLPPIGSTDGQGGQAIVHCKFFTPDAGWTWYVTEFDQADTFFGLVVGHETELGDFSLSELQQVRGALGLPIERDLHFKPKPLKELRECPPWLKG